MKRKLAILALTAATLTAQTFEVASVKRSALESGSSARSTGALPRRQESLGVNYPRVSLKAVMVFAWELAPDQISGPQWLDDERYDIVATLPADASQSQIPVMLQHLLVERFRMTIHEESRTRQGLALVVGKDGPKLKKSNDTSRPGFEESNGKTTFMKETLAVFARLLTNYGGSPVSDETHLDGEYDITVKATPAELRSGVISIPDAIQDLGLRLETRNQPARFVVIDKADKTPTGN